MNRTLTVRILVPSPSEDAKNPTAPRRRRNPESRHSPDTIKIAHDIDIAREQSLDLRRQYRQRPRHFGRLPLSQSKPPNFTPPGYSFAYAKATHSGLPHTGSVARPSPMLDPRKRHSARAFFETESWLAESRAQFLVNHQKSVLYNWQSPDRARPLTGFQRGESKRRGNLASDSRAQPEMAEGDFFYSKSAVTH